MSNKTKALLIGINNYAPDRKNYYDLEGCINDVKDMAADGGTYLGSGRTIFLLALAAGVDLLFSIAIR